MNRPRESLLTLFDPLFSGEPTTPPFRDVPSPDLGSDKENAAPPEPAGDSPITLTKFFSRTYTRHKAQLPQPLSKGRLIDFGDPSVLDHSDSDSDDERDLVVRRETQPTGVEDAQGSPQRRPLADIALGDSRSSPIAMKKTLPTAGASSSPFGSPSPFKLVRPSPAPSSSPLASVINAINGATSPTPPSTPSAPRIAVTPAEPPASPSPTRQQRRPGVMLHVFPETDPRRTSVDLQESLSMHFDGSSFDLLKEKISLPENDSLGDLEMDMEIEVHVKKMPVIGYQGDRDAVSNTNAESEDELDIDGLLAERLCDVNLSEDEVAQKDEDKDNMSTPPAQLASCNLPTPQAPVRQFVRPKTKLQAPGAPTSSRSSALFPRRSARTSITALPIAAPTAALRITKKGKPEGVVMPAAAPVLARQTAGGVFSGPAPTCSSSSVLPSRTMALGGVQRPPAHAKVAVPAAASAPASARVPSQLNKQKASQVPKVGMAGVAGPRPSGLRAPTSRVGVAGTAVRRASVVGGPTRPSTTTVGGRLGLSGMIKAVSAAGKGDSASSTARMMRRV